MHFQSFNVNIDQEVANDKWKKWKNLHNCCETYVNDFSPFYFSFVHYFSGCSIDCMHFEELFIWHIAMSRFVIERKIRHQLTFAQQENEWIKNILYKAEHCISTCVCVYFVLHQRRLNGKNSRVEYLQTSTKLWICYWA